MTVLPQKLIEIMADAKVDANDPKPTLEEMIALSEVVAMEAECSQEWLVKAGYRAAPDPGYMRRMAVADATARLLKLILSNQKAVTRVLKESAR